MSKMYTNSNNTPTVSVIMPLFNGEAYINETIDSILNQTFTDFELIIVDDCSTDNSVKIVESYSDARIKLLKNKKNSGAAYTRNRALDVAKGKYLIFADSDDISLPKRFEKQIKFMDENPNIGISGTHLIFSGLSRKIKYKKPVDPEITKLYLLFEAPMLQSAVIMRKSIVDEHSLRYPEINPSQDYAFWAIVSNYTEMCNLNEHLVIYRFHPTQISVKKADKQIENDLKIKEQLYKKLGIELTEENKRIIKTFMFDKHIPKVNFDEVYEFFNKIMNKNKEKNLYDQDKLQQVLVDRWHKLCYKASKQGIPAIHQLYRFKFYSFINLMKFSIKILLIQGLHTIKKINNKTKQES